MPKIVCRRCPFTGKIFDDLDEYAQHLSTQRKSMQTERHNSRMKDEFKEWLAAERSAITFVGMIPQWFMDNQRKIINAVSAGHAPGRHGQFFDGDKFTILKFERCDYHSKVRNSHVCPDSGVTNWGEKGDAPTFYEGWKGYIRGRLTRKAKYRTLSYPASASLTAVGIKTGSGGGGNDDFGYEFNIFLDDWPGLRGWVDDLKQQEIAKILSTGRRSVPASTWAQ
jgi:hypothetical protein